MATQQQRKGVVKTKHPVPWRSTISRLVCVYEWSPTAQLSRRARAAPSPTKAAPDAGAMSGGEGEANGDEDREQESDANMHARVGAHGGGWQTHLKVRVLHSIPYNPIPIRRHCAAPPCEHVLVLLATVH